jgi:hypothetical protein
MWYAEHFATRYDAVDRTFCDAIKNATRHLPGHLSARSKSGSPAPSRPQCDKSSAKSQWKLPKPARKRPDNFMRMC